MLQIAALTVFALLLARVLRAPRGTWRYVLGAAGAALAASQFLPEGNAFRQDVAGSSRVLFWIGLGLIPVAAYAVLVRRLRRRLGLDLPEAPARPQGLVRFAEDDRLAADTAVALAAEGLPAEAVSLGWRTPDGALAGHVRLLLRGETAEIALLRVAPERRGQGVGAALLRAAEGEAAARGARRIGALATDGQGPEFFARAGFVAGGAHDLGGGRRRRWMEKAL